MGMLKEFKEFAVRGNLIELAVAFVMGLAFGKVTSAFIDGIIMPIVGKLTAGVDFKSLKIVLTEATYDGLGNIVTPEAAIKYGEFIAVLLDFILVAWFMFLLVKFANKVAKKEGK